MAQEGQRNGFKNIFTLSPAQRNEYFQLQNANSPDMFAGAILQWQCELHYHSDNSTLYVDRMTITEAQQSTYHTYFTGLVKTWAALRQTRTDAEIVAFESRLGEFKSWSESESLISLRELLYEIEHLIPESNAQFNNTVVGSIDLLLNQLIIATKNTENSYLHKQVAQHDSQPITRKRDTSIAIIDDSELARLSTKAMLDRFNFNVSCYESIDDFKQTKDIYTHTDVVLLDVVMPDVTEDILFSFAAQLRKNNVQVIMVSGAESLNLRLKAVRSDIGGYVIKPFDINVLVSNIRWICNLDVTRPFQVVLLDDQQSIGQYLGSYAKTLSIELIFYSNSMEFFDSLDSGVPDLFLLDINLPDISGLEVCKVLRQQKRFDYVPIVFLSTDDSLDTKLEALSAGAEDIIIKHNPPDIIFKQVEKRIIRGQRVRSMAVKDSLTGLLNHGQMMEAAASAFRLARRNNQNITVAMIDIDNFKKVNDTYGHMIGDNVIVGLAQLLKASVRDSDVVGRYGGEEFLIIFHSEDLAAIESKLNMLRQTFEQLTFNARETMFKCSFSCGVATAKEDETFKDVINRADQTMYEVKRDGKNAVRVSS